MSEHSAGMPGLRRADIAGLLAKTIGSEKASKVVDTAARDLGFLTSTLNREAAHKLLSKISEEPGLVGMAAMFAKSQLHFVSAASQFESIDS
ncbi:MAG: hypothetical protein AAF657_18645 [Acidobacteriota bacterium]